MADYHAIALQAVLRRLASSSGLAAVVLRVAAEATKLNAALSAAVKAEVPQYSSSGNPDVLPEAAAHAARHTEEILRLLRGGAVADFDFVRDHARRRAEQRFPLEATLHAYRSAQKVFSRWLREALLAATPAAADAQHDMAAIADFALEYTDAISTRFASHYSSHTLRMAEVAGAERAEILQLLLNGHDEADLRVARLLRDAGFPDRRQSFCVALARSVDPAEMLNAARARRLADAIEAVIADCAVGRIIDIHVNKVTMVFADVRRDSGWTAPRGSLCAQIAAALQFVGNAALIGVSSDVPSTAHIPTAHREALAALELADAAHRVVRFEAIPLQRLLLHFAADDLRRLLPAWSREFREADQRAGGALGATLRAYADADMNVQRAAQVLGLHPNTLYARFERIEHITGLPARSFHSLSALLVVCDCKVDTERTG